MNLLIRSTGGNGWIEFCYRESLYGLSERTASMDATVMNPQSDFIVYVDESGDHGMARYDPEFPVFILTFCVFNKQEYATRIVPSLQLMKFKYFGHDMVVFHEREIRKATGHFAFLTDQNQRTDFHSDISKFVENSPFSIIAVVIHKHRFSNKHADGNPYHFALQLGLEGVHRYLAEKEQSKQMVHFVFEARGKKEDRDLELEFLRACQEKGYPYLIVIANKQVNSTGLQLADLTARPVGRFIMNPDQPNRAYDIIKMKLACNEDGNVDDYGLNCYP